MDRLSMDITHLFSSPLLDDDSTAMALVQSFQYSNFFQMAIGLERKRERDHTTGTKLSMNWIPVGGCWKKSQGLRGGTFSTQIPALDTSILNRAQSESTRFQI